MILSLILRVPRIINMFVLKWKLLFSIFVSK